MNWAPTIIGLGWIGFWLYWIVASRWAKRNKRLIVSWRLTRARMVVLLLTIAVVVGFCLLPVTIKEQPLGTGMWATITGVCLFIAGIGLALWARICLGSEWGMPMTLKERPHLITTGPYAFVRHPIYTGTLCMALASAITVNSYWLLIFGLSLLYFLYSALAEERAMSREFGAVYSSYKQKTKMLIPFVL